MLWQRQLCLILFSIALTSVLTEVALGQALLAVTLACLCRVTWSSLCWFLPLITGASAAWRVTSQVQRQVPLVSGVRRNRCATSLGRLALGAAAAAETATELSRLMTMEFVLSPSL